MVSRNSAFLGLSKEIKFSHKADHSKLVKFPTKEDALYLRITAYVREFLSHPNKVTREYSRPLHNYGADFIQGAYQKHR